MSADMQCFLFFCAGMAIGIGIGWWGCHERYMIAEENRAKK